MVNSRAVEKHGRQHPRAQVQDSAHAARVKVNESPRAVVPNPGPGGTPTLHVLHVSLIKHT